MPKNPLSLLEKYKNTEIAQLWIDRAFIFIPVKTRC